MEVKSFKTYEEQLDILESRGMIIQDREYALNCLREENYYRLSGYWYHLLTKDSAGSECFNEGTSFESVMDLYEFDKDMRMLLLAATSVIETKLKAYIAYYHARTYGPTGYMNVLNFECTEYFATMLSAMYKDANRQKSSAFVRHHMTDKAGVFPVWAAVELFTFDQASKFFSNMHPLDQGNIAREFYGISSREYIESWLRCSVILRNTAAHGGRLYNRKFDISIRLKKPGIEKTLFGYVYGVKKLLPDQKQQSFISAIKECIKNHPQIELERIGFSNDWETVLST